MGNGNFGQSRRIKETAWYQNPNERAVMRDLLDNAYYSTFLYTKENKNIPVHRGDLVVSIRKHAKWLGMSVRTYRTTVKNLQEKGEIKARVTQSTRIVSICKYDTYHTKKRQTDTVRHSQRIPKVPESKGIGKQKNIRPTQEIIKHKKSLEDRSDFDSKQSVYKTRETAKIKGADPQQNPKHKNTEFEHKEFYLFGIFDYYPGKKDIEKARKEFNKRIRNEGDFFDLCVTTEIYLEACSRRKSKPTSLRQFLIEWRDHQANPAKEISDWDIAAIKGEAELYYQFIANLQVKKGKKTWGIPLVCKSGSAPEKIIFEFKDPETLKFLRGIRTRHSIDSHSSIS